MNSDDSSTRSTPQRQADFDFSSLSLDFKSTKPRSAESEAINEDSFGMEGILGNLDYEEEEMDPFVAMKAKKTSTAEPKAKKTAGISLEGLRSKAKSKNEFAELFGSSVKSEALKASNEELEKAFQSMGISTDSPVVGGSTDSESGNGETDGNGTSIPTAKSKSKLKLKSKSKPKSKSKKVLTITNDLSVLNVSKLFGIPIKECIERLKEYEPETESPIHSKDDLVSTDAIELLAMDLDIEVQVNNRFNLQPTNMETSPPDLPSRPPVIAVMGHVDHGKTTLLDRLRQSSVAAHEAGGITQAISAFNVKLSSDNVITFIDTPGHAAFTAMRKRGATATDIVLLIVAGDDGVKEQTVECLKLIHDTKLPAVVAVTKCGKKNVDKDKAIHRIATQLLDYDLITTPFGGDVNIIGIDSITGDGIEDLKNLLYEEGVMHEIRADPKVIHSFIHRFICRLPEKESFSKAPFERASERISPL